MPCVFTGNNFKEIEYTSLSPYLLPSLPPHSSHSGAFPLATPSCQPSSDPASPAPAAAVGSSSRCRGRFLGVRAADIGRTGFCSEDRLKQGMVNPAADDLDTQVQASLH